MVSLEKLANELNVNQFDQELKAGLAITWTTGGNSTIGDWTWTTNKWGYQDYFQAWSEDVDGDD